MIFLLTGNSGAGKTTLLNELSVLMAEAGLITGGFTACGKWKDGMRSGFVLHDIKNNLDYPLAKTGTEGPEMYGRFVFNEETLKTGNRLLQQQSLNPQIDLIIIDEVGPFEIKGRGWAASLDMLVHSVKIQIWSVRPDLVQTVQTHWEFEPTAIYIAGVETTAQVFQRINEICSFK